MSKHSIEACTFQLHSWRPFLNLTASIESSSDPTTTTANNPHLSNSYVGPTLTKRPCLSDRATSFPIDLNSIDISKLSLSDEKAAASRSAATRGSLRLIAHRKRRRRGSRSVSGRSCSDRSGTRRCCSVGAASAAGAHGTCSDFHVAVATDSSGEMFGNGGGGGEPNWASDASEAKKPSSREKEEREGFGCNGQFGNFEVGPGNESGYGSEPGYRGDGEFGYGDEVDEEEEDSRVLFWGDAFGDVDSKMEMVGESTFVDQKSHHRGRRKKHDCRMICSLN